jgi:hypothetical protein
MTPEERLKAQQGKRLARDQSPRERAARALCRRDGNPENAKFEGRRSCRISICSPSRRI